MQIDEKQYELEKKDDGTLVFTPKNAGEHGVEGKDWFWVPKEIGLNGEGKDGESIGIMNLNIPGTNGVYPYLHKFKDLDGYSVRHNTNQNTGRNYKAVKVDEPIDGALMFWGGINLYNHSIRNKRCYKIIIGDREWYWSDIGGIDDDPTGGTYWKIIKVG